LSANAHDPHRLTAAAFDVLAGTLPLGSVGFAREPDADGDAGAGRASSCCGVTA
jgi:hypothetical protein